MKASSKNARAQGNKCAGTPQSLLSATQYVDGILKGDRCILARAITLIESSRADDQELAQRIIESFSRSSSDSIRIGVTGIPGAGKSTLIEALGRHIITNCGEKLAVLAIDPSSRVSGGSILGDKTRMTFLASSDKAFVRPTPARGALGGVAHHTREAIVLCEAAGYTNVFVETVGVGQSETVVRDMVDFFLLVAIAGAGDDLQGIKRGVMEMTDAVVVNKADGENIRAAELACAEANAALRFMPACASGWSPRAALCSARTGNGVQQVWSCILAHHAMSTANGWLKQLRREQNLHWMHESLQEGLMQLFMENPIVKQRLALLEQRVTAGQITPVNGARELLSIFESDRAESDKNERNLP